MTLRTLGHWGLSFEGCWLVLDASGLHRLALIPLLMAIGIVMRLLWRFESRHCMTDQTSPATALPVVAYCIQSSDQFMWPPTDGSRPFASTWQALTPQAPAQATIDVLRAEVERLTRELAALAQAGGDDAWQPIDTAPKDGSGMLALWVHPGDYVTSRNYALVEFVRGCWRDTESDDQVYTQPTHWMHLPKPPLHRLTDSALPCAGTNCGATTGSGTPDAQA